jgi:hypothetical protein
MTKCIRVGISDTTKEVVDVLIEKFRPDMKMLTRNSYALHEVHVNGGNEIKIKKNNDNDSARHRSQDICQPIFQIVLKNLIKISLYIVIIKE